MSIHTHIIDQPNNEFKNVLNEAKKKLDLIENYIDKNKTLKGIEGAIGIKFVDPLQDSKK